MLDTARIKDLIIKKQIDLLRTTVARGEQEGMMIFDQSLFNLYKEGKISYENTIAYSDCANDLRLRIKTERLEEVKDDKTTSFRLK